MRTVISKRKLWRRVEWALTAMLIAVPLVLVAVWLALHHKPSWYVPAILDQTRIQQARRQAVTTADFISDRMVEGRPFTVVLTEQSVNEWLTALPHAWPDARDALPPEFSNPAIGFRDGKLWIGAHYVAEKWQAIISLGLRFDSSKDKAELAITLEGACGGSLPLPKMIVRQAFEQLLGQGRRGKRELNGTTRPLLDALQAIQSADELFEGVAVKNRFVWFNGERPYRIESIEIGKGELRLTIEPL